MRKLSHLTLGAQKHAVREEDQWEHQVGDRVLADGLPGVIAEVQSGPYPGNEAYVVTLDNGLGGGEYDARMLTKLDPTLASLAGPIVPPTSLEPVEAGSPVLATHWYPELGSILEDRPPIEQIVRTAGLQRTAAVEGDDETYYHGSRWTHKPGDILTGGFGHGNQGYGEGGDHVYYTKRHDVASAFAEAGNGPPGHVNAIPKTYRVEPIEGHEDDPDEDEEAQSFRAPKVRVLHEVPYDHEGAKRVWGVEASLQRTAAADHDTLYHITPEQHQQHKDRALDYLRDNRGFDDEDISHLRSTWAAKMPPQYPGESGVVRCDNCGKYHSATPVHVSPTQGQIHEVVCDDGLSDYYTDERVERRPHTAAGVLPDDASQSPEDGTERGEDLNVPSSCSFCGNAGPWTDEQNTGRGTRIRCGTCGGTMRLNSDELAGTSGIQWQPEFPNSPQNHPSRAGDPRATLNDYRTVASRPGDNWMREPERITLNAAASAEAGYTIFTAPELARAVDEQFRVTAAALNGVADEDFTFQMVASWNDVQEKAKRIRAEGGVRIVAASAMGVVGEVQGDNAIYESEMNYVPGSKRVAAWHCFLPDAPVTMADGTERAISQVRPGDRVLTHLGNAKTVIKAQPKPFTGGLTSIRFRGDSRAVVATSEHEVWTKDGWREIGSLVPGEYLSSSTPQAETALVVSVPVPTRRPVSSASGSRGVRLYRRGEYERWQFVARQGGRNGVRHVQYFATRDEAVEYSDRYYAERAFVDVKIDQEMANLLGWYAAEGFVRTSGVGYQVGFSLSAEERDVAERLDDVIWTRFGVRGQIRQIDNKLDYRVSDFRLHYLCASLVGRGAHGKQLSESMMTLPLAEQKAFLAGWVSGDGHADQKTGRVTLATVSETLVRQGRDLLARLGEVGSISWSDKNQGGLPTTQNAKRIYQLRWVPQGHTRRFQLRDVDRTWRQIEHVSTEPFSGEVWDIEVDDDHSFRAYGIDVHNCGCKWGAYAWGRSPAYRRFEGRQCSHVLALQYEANSRGMFGRDVSPDRDRMEGQYQRTPVQVEHQRATDRAPEREIRRRTVPPGNMRRTFSSKTAAFEDIPPVAEWARFLTALGNPPSKVIDGLLAIGVPHRAAREALDWATKSPASTEFEVDGVVHQAMQIDGDVVLTVDGLALDGRTASLRTAMPWHQQGNGEDAQTMQAKSVRHAGFKGYVGSGDMFGDGDEEEDHGGFDEDAYDRATPEPTHEEAAHHEEHGEYPDSFYERHDQAYQHELDKKSQEDVPDHDDEHLHHFIGEHGTDTEEWKRHEPQPQRIDLRNGVYATQSHVSQKHIDKYLANPDAETHRNNPRNKYLGDETPLFVTHHGNLHAIEGHHRVAAALQRGDSHMDGYHYNLDKHPVATLPGRTMGMLDKDKPRTPCENCQVHTGEYNAHIGARSMVGQDDLGTGISGIGTRDQSDRKKHRKHVVHHTNDARSHAPQFGYGLPWGGIYGWCGQCNGSGCGHCNGTGQVAVSGQPTNTSDLSSTESPVSDQSVDAGSMAGGDGGGIGATSSLRADKTCACCQGTGEHTCGHECYACDSSGKTHEDDGGELCAMTDHLDDDPGRPGFEHDIRPDRRGDLGRTASLHVADYDTNSFGNGGPAPAQGRTPHAHTPNPGSTGWASSADPGGWGASTNSSAFGLWESSLSAQAAAEQEPPTVSGVALKAADTGRVLMIQRSNKDEKDPARGTWEFPGGHHEPGDQTSLHAGIREWEEEVGQPFPEGGHVAHTWRSGPYQGHVVVVPGEHVVDFSNGRATTNPDDPDGDDHEQSAWWDVDHAKKNPALRPELKGANPFADIKKAAGNGSVTMAGSVGGNEPGRTYNPSTGTTARFMTMDEARAASGASSLAEARQMLDAHHQWQESYFPAAERIPSPWGVTSELHDEPEPALPSTTGDNDGDDDVATIFGYGGDDEDGAVPGLDENRAAPWGFPESAADHVDPQVAQPPGPVQDTGAMQAQAGLVQAAAHVPEEVALAASFNPALADFTQTAGFKALAVDVGAGPDQGGGVTEGGPPNDSDIAKAAQALLQKTSMKNFSFAEQQDLITEGGGKARARNFGDLNIGGTHYANLTDDGQVDEDLLSLGL